MVWLIWATIHVLAFPALWAAATGYINPSIALYEMPDGTFAGMDSEKLAPCLIINDGSRVGLEDSVAVVGKSFREFYLSWIKHSYSLPSVDPDFTSDDGLELLKGNYENIWYFRFTLIL